MNSLIKQVQNLQNNKQVSKIIKQRINSFKKIGQNNNKIFSELLFCILTANFQAQKSCDLQKKYTKYFLTKSENEIAQILKKEGHRFWPQRAKRIVLVREKKNDLLINIKKEKPRDWIVKNIHGIGMKEASHFLRNIGFLDYAIIDFHIIDLLIKEKLIFKPKTLTKNKYLEIEKILEKLTKKLNISQGELDLYLWYLETGKILK